IRNHFPKLVLPHPVRANVKLAEAPSFGQTIFEYAPDSNGAQDYVQVARDLMEGEIDDPDLAPLPRAVPVEPPAPVTSRARIPDSAAQKKKEEPAPVAERA